METRAPKHTITPRRPMFDTICTLPLSADLFAQAIHPTAPLVAVGLSSGHVATLKLPPVEDDETQALVNELGKQGKGGILGRRGSNGTGVVDTAWKTKRHKGSCRCLAYSLDGLQLYSAGTDGVVKAADAETGQVTGKVGIPQSTSSTNKSEGPTVIHALTPQTLLLGTDGGALHLYDLRDPAPTLPFDSTSDKTAFTSAKPAQTHRPHPDDITSLTPLPASATSTSGYSKQFLTTGSTTLALTDLRRGVLVQSEDQEELLLSSLYITGLPARKASGSSGEKAVVGGADGVVTLWEKGLWDDQDERVVVSREKETVDALAEIPDGIGGFGRKVAAGLGDGKIRFIRFGQNQVVGEVQHDELEGVVELGFDVGGRMISGGGQVVKVWREHIEAEAEDEDAEEQAALGKKGSDSEDGEDGDGGGKEESSEEEEQPRKRRKKRKRSKAPPKPSGLSFAGLD
ncbi:hypothetical protein LTR08_002572 [Meristemomyces frigidus]|nr:hypothetical protein LTR08_002572 [Meristemomyces frigidus]